MANRSFRQFMYTPRAMPVMIDVDVPIGATGAVGTLSGPGVSSITRSSAGIYQVNFADNYTGLFQFYSQFQSPNSGSDVAITALVTNTTYVITTVGNSNWQTAGLKVGVTAAIGVSFKATGVGTGTGQAQVPLATGSGIAMVDIVGNPNLTLNPVGVGVVGGYVTIRCLAATAAGTTTFIATDPANGSVMNLKFYLNNSSVTQ